MTSPVVRRRHAVRRFAPTVALLVAGAFVLASCSSPAPTPPTTTSAPSTTSSTTSTAPPTSTTTSVPAATVASCSAAALSLAEDSAKSTAGAGSSYVAYTLTNTGATACALDGFPKIEFFGPSGASGAGAGPKLSTAAQQSGAPAARVILDAGGAGAFYLVVGDVPVGGVGCSSVASIDVTPPESSEALAVPSSIDPCGPSVGVTAIEPLAALST